MTDNSASLEKPEPPKRTMRLPKNSAYPHFNETHPEDNWCAKAGCTPACGGEAQPGPPIPPDPQREAFERECQAGIARKDPAWLYIAKTFNFTSPAPSSSPLETPSQRRSPDHTTAVDVKGEIEFIEWIDSGQSSPKPAESPFETQTGRIFAQLNTVCFHSRMHGDCVGCLLGHAERLEIALNEGATPSPELAKALIDFISTHDMRWDDLASETEWGNVMELARNESRIISSCGGSHAETGVAFQSSTHSALRSASLDAAGQSSPHGVSSEPPRQTPRVNHGGPPTEEELRFTARTLGVKEFWGGWRNLTDPNWDKFYPDDIVKLACEFAEAYRDASSHSEPELVKGLIAVEELTDEARGEWAATNMSGPWVKKLSLLDCEVIDEKVVEFAVKFLLAHTAPDSRDVIKRTLSAISRPRGESLEEAFDLKNSSREPKGLK